MRQGSRLCCSVVPASQDHDSATKERLSAGKYYEEALLSKDLEISHLKSKLKMNTNLTRMGMSYGTDEDSECQRAHMTKMGAKEGMNLCTWDIKAQASGPRYQYD